MFVFLFIASLAAIGFLLRRLSHWRKLAAGPEMKAGDGSSSLLALSETLEQHGRGQSPAAPCIEKETPVRLRWLPDGRWTEAQAMESQGRWLRVNVPDDVNPADCRSGAPLEIQTPATLYLAEVQSRQEHSLLVRLQQRMDTQKLAELNRAWDEYGQHRPRV